MLKPLKAMKPQQKKTNGTTFKAPTFLKLVILLNQKALN